MREKAPASVAYARIRRYARRFCLCLGSDESARPLEARATSALGRSSFRMARNTPSLWAPRASLGAELAYPWHATSWVGGPLCQEPCGPLRAKWAPCHPNHRQAGAARLAQRAPTQASRLRRRAPATIPLWSEPSPLPTRRRAQPVPLGAALTLNKVWNASRVAARAGQATPHMWMHGCARRSCHAAHMRSVARGLWEGTLHVHAHLRSHAKVQEQVRKCRGQLV